MAKSVSVEMNGYSNSSAGRCKNGTLVIEDDIRQMKDAEELLKQEYEIRARWATQELLLMQKDHDSTKRSTSRALNNKIKHEKELQRITSSLVKLESDREVLEKRLRREQRSQNPARKNVLLDVVPRNGSKANAKVSYQPYAHYSKEKSQIEAASAVPIASNYSHTSTQSLKSSLQKTADLPPTEEHIY